MSVHRKHQRGGTFRPLALITAVLLMLGVFMAPVSATATEDDVVDETAVSTEEKAPAPESAPKEETAPKQDEAPAPDPAPAVQKEQTVKSAPADDSESTDEESTDEEEVVDEEDDSEEPAAEPTFEDVSVVPSGTCTFTVTSPAGNPALLVIYNDGQRDGMQGQFTIDGGQSVVTTPTFDARFGNVSDPASSGEYFQEFELNLSNCDGSQPPQEEPVKKIEFCHAKPADTAKNGWVLLETSTRAFFKSGHPEHAADIVPPFFYEDPNGDVVEYPGLNWDEDGQAIFDNGCVKPDDEEPPVDSEDPTVVVDTEAIPCLDPYDYEATTSVSYSVTNPEDGAGDEEYTTELIAVYDGGEDSVDTDVLNVEDGATAPASFEGLYPGDYLIRVTTSDGLVVDSAVFTVESCEVATPENVLITSQVCDIVTFDNPNEDNVLVEYGSFDELGPDGSIVVEAGGSANITTDRSMLDGLVSIGGFVFQEFEDIAVSQDGCDNDGGTTPPVDNGGDDGDPVVTTPVSNAPTAPMKDSPVNAVLPNTGAPELTALWVGAALLLLGGLMVRRRKTIG